MKRLFSTLALAAATLVALGLLSVSQARADSWTGWISDSACGAKGASADHKQCAITCVNDKGAKWVLVKSDTKDVIAIQNQDAVSADNVGMEVNVTGTLNEDKTIHVDSIAAAGK
ncbi:MAG TPA: hypothetical protein VL523_14565 [Terriglobia bacterium]|nr:hypothetical protein [Terriglobia bacterium]